MLECDAALPRCAGANAAGIALSDVRVRFAGGGIGGREGSMTPLQISLVTAAAIGLACAMLSVFVVLRRWAFIGEGIAHASFGGAGAGWGVSLMVPGGGLVRTPVGVYWSSAVFFRVVALARG